jgi:PPOX class probable F420-dependent enzyme
VARLATVDPSGAPHVVPVCPVLDGDAVVFATDASAKLRNLEADPRCALVFDEYVEDWDHLRQVLVRGRAEILTEGPAWERGKAMLEEKFLQYEPMAPITPGRTRIVRVRIEQVAGGLGDQA